MNEQHPEHHGNKGLAHDALHDLVHFDSKLFRTVPPLVFKPGKVTEATLAGETGYVKPFTLFVFFNFLFFIVKTKGLIQYTLENYAEQFDGRIAQKMADLHISRQILAERFNMAMRFEQKEYLIIMVPLFALGLQVLYFRAKAGFGAHLVFALNFYAFFIIFLIIIPYIIIPADWLVRRLHVNAGVVDSENTLVLIILAVCLNYLRIALKRVYRQQLWLTIIKSALLSVMVIFLVVMVYRTALFFIVMHAVGE